MAFPGTVGILSDAFSSGFRQSRQNEQRNLEQNRRLQENQRQFGLIQQQQQAQLSQEGRLAEARDLTNRDIATTNVRKIFRAEETIPKKLRDQLSPIKGAELNQDFPFDAFTGTKDYYRADEIDSLLDRQRRGPGLQSKVVGDELFTFNPATGTYAVAIDPRDRRQLTIETTGLTKRQSRVSEAFADYSDIIGSTVQQVGTDLFGGQKPKDEFRRLFPSGDEITYTGKEFRDVKKRAFAKVVSSTDAVATELEKRHKGFEGAYKELLRIKKPENIDRVIETIMDQRGFNAEAKRRMRELIKMRIFDKATFDVQR